MTTHLKSFSATVLVKAAGRPGMDFVEMAVQGGIFLD